LQDCQTKRDKIVKYSSLYLFGNDSFYHKWTQKLLGNDQRMHKHLVVPLEERGKLLHHFHNELGHTGVVRTLSRLKKQYFWRTIKKDVARHIQSCKESAKKKSPKSIRPVPLNPISVSEPLEIAGVDFGRPLAVTEVGNHYIMTFQDQFM